MHSIITPFPILVYHSPPAPSQGEGLTVPRPGRGMRVPPLNPRHTLFSEYTLSVFFHNNQTHFLRFFNKSYVLYSSRCNFSATFCSVSSFRMVFFSIPMLFRPFESSGHQRLELLYHLMHGIPGTSVHEAGDECP